MGAGAGYAEEQECGSSGMACHANRYSSGASGDRRGLFSALFSGACDHSGVSGSAARQSVSGKLAWKMIKTKQTIWVNGLLRGVYK